MVLHIAPPQGISPKALQFFPFEEGKVEYAAAQPLTRENDVLRLEIPAARQAIGAWTRVAGLLVADAPLAASGMQAIEIDVPVGAASVASGSVGVGFAAALALAFGGGLLLNLMPCVLPVLSIKILGIAQHGGHRKHGLIYGLLALKAGGESLGWGFQLQSPLFVAMLALLFFALALNLSGVFEFGSLVPSSLLGVRASRPALDAFLGGVLAVVVASPCTAPFMGAALGYALATDALSSMAVFTALGVGMALPFVLLAWHPGWLARLPRAGAWMVRLKQFLAFPLYGTVVWLAWVLGMQAGLDAVIVLLAALVTLSVGAWLLGISFERACLGRIAAAAFVVGALVLVAPLERSEASSALSRADDAWEPWSHERIAALSAQGRPVFVDFTAAWCVTCQVNKRLVLSQPDVEQAFRDRGVALLRADWTRRDPAIAAALAGFGRSGVPVYVLYPPGGEPRLLPEILTREGVIDALADFPRRKESS
jgi:thiol:disulfide interchange protein DsbD